MMATANAGDALRALLGRRRRPAARRRARRRPRDDARVGPRDDPHENLLRVDERGVRLVLVGGRPVLGTPVAAGGRRRATGDVEPLDVGGVRKGVVMRLPDELLPPDPVLQRRGQRCRGPTGWRRCSASSTIPPAAVRAAQGGPRAPAAGRADPAGVRARHAGPDGSRRAAGRSPTTSSTSSSSRRRRRWPTTPRGSHRRHGQADAALLRRLRDASESSGCATTAVVGTSSPDGTESSPADYGARPCAWGSSRARINDGTIDDVVAEARQAEADGFASFWTAQIFGHDALTRAGDRRARGARGSSSARASCRRTRGTR